MICVIQDTIPVISRNADATPFNRMTHNNL